jgi:hypothetical protein
VAPTPVDTDLEMLNELAAHARKLLTDFVDLLASARPRQTELIAEFEEVVRYFVVYGLLLHLNVGPTCALQLIRNRSCVRFDNER